MRQKTGIFLMILMIFNLGGYYVIFFSAQHDLRSEIRKNPGSYTYTNNISVLKVNIVNGKIDDPDFKMVDDGEISYKGVMYDVLKIEGKNDIASVFCINDQQETSLLANLNENIEGSYGNLPSKKKNASLKLLEDYVYPAPLRLQPSCNQVIALYPFLVLDINSNTRSITSPPPKA